MALEYGGMRNQNQRFSANSNPESTDVSQLVQQVLKELGPEFERQSVCVEADLSELVVTIVPATIQKAVRNLIQHALVASPDQGEISVTLIDGNYQWELEVADSSNGENWHTVHPNQRKLPTIISNELDVHLSAAHRLALSQGGQIQTWNCPQGGIANVLIVPKHNESQTNLLRRSA